MHGEPIAPHIYNTRRAWVVIADPGWIEAASAPAEFGEFFLAAEWVPRYNKNV